MFADKKSITNEGYAFIIIKTLFHLLLSLLSYRSLLNHILVVSFVLQFE